MQEPGKIIFMEFNLKTTFEILERTPQILNTLLSGLSEHWIFSNEGNDTWSAFDIVGHLLHGEKTDWIARLKIILSEGSNKTFEPFDRFAQFQNSKGKPLSELLHEFSRIRQQNISYLKSLNISDKQLGFKGIHPALGEVTLRELLATWVTHDLGHIAQIARVMAKQYKDEVGPWEAYIPILNK